MGINNRHLNIYYQNVRGLRTKTLPFRLGIMDSGFDVVAITETWLNGSIYNSELFPAGYDVYRRDRSGVGVLGGGVLLAVSDKIKSCRLYNLETEGENLWIKLSFSEKITVILGLVYFKPNSQMSTYKSFFSKLDSLNLSNEQLIILGDFNLHIYGENFDLSTGNEICKQLMFFCNLHNIVLKNNILNCDNRTLDLVLSNIDSMGVKEEHPVVKKDKYHPPLGIDFELLIEKKTNFSCNNQGGKFYNFKNVDYLKLYTAVRNIKWDSVYSCSDVDLAVDNFYSSLYSALDSNVPLRKNVKRKYPIWYSPVTIKLIKDKEKSRRKLKKYKDQCFTEEYKELRCQSKRSIKTDYLKYLNDIENTIKVNPNSFWSIIKGLRSSDSRVAAMTLDGEEVEGSVAITEAFATYFQSVYVPTHLDNEELYRQAVCSPAHAHSGCLAFGDVTEEELLLALKKLKPKRSVGPDGVPSFIFKGCAELLVKPLLKIFNLSIGASYFPNLWKTTKVVPIHKKGKKSDIKNYRPVAILSTPAKLFEAVLYDRVFNHVKFWITPLQHGFYPRRSINTNLMNFSDFCISSLDKGGQVDVIYTDFEKAFDKVNHLSLLSKLNYLGITCNGLRFFSTYLHNRKQFVFFQGSSSSEFVVSSGVPQGSNLGPLLFIIFINDIVNSVLNSKVLLYADDLKIFREINDVSDCLLLQQDLDRLVAWSDVGLKFHSDKCFVVSYTRRTHNAVNFQYSMNGNLLGSRSSVTDLGVTIDSKLCFSNHVIESCRSAYRILGFIFRSGSFITNIYSLKLLYCTLVRPKLEFGATVWYPHQTYLVDMIEQIQIKFLRYLFFKKFGYFTFDVSYHTLLNLFEMVSLKQRRDMGMLIFLHKLLNDKVDDSELLSRLAFLVRRPSSRARALFSPSFSRTCLGAQSPINTMMRLYNLISNNVDIFNSNLASYKKSLISHNG